MKNFAKTIVLCTSLTMALAACSEPTKEVQKVRITATAQMNAEDLTNAGEQLLSPYTLHLSKKVFEKALEKDPGNKKAQFYNIFLKRFMIFEGILTRAKPYAEKYGDADQLAKTTKEIPQHPTRQFLTVPAQNAKNIENLSDMQKLLIEYRNAANELRQFIAKNADASFVLYMNPSLMSDMIREQMTDSCVLLPGNEDTIADVQCDFSEVAMKKVNMADLMVLKQYAAAEVLYLSLYTGYSIQGIDELVKRSETEQMTAQDIMERLEKIPGALTLNKDQSLTAIRSLGADFSVAFKWAVKYQKDLCPKDKNGEAIPRKGYIFNNLCIDDLVNAQESIAKMDKALSGPVNEEFGGEDNKKTITVDYMALFKNPVTDLRKLMPATWNNEGTAATSFRDKTLGGLLPNGDADQILKEENSN
ncbi:hypothetical protein EZJ49_03825 [Bdellovibrio bacteriovorus]|uniref:hypothetical protein n=1 Tax=Bdellovibrio bacteriovorus TaxID=959 RepID=UPI0021CE46B3|nr:hypothetical protein [Bdellovibrio bacteriovorus]UXR65380.1 hypothetical protein EZJ49_03825 [Bdellovibrio bacteriovorus]